MGKASVEERREVAGRLRACSGHGLLGLYSAVLGDDAKNRTAVLYKRLADLIDPGEDTTVSAYDLLPEEDRETLRWVNEHGGLENVSDAWDEAVNLCATIGCEPNDASEMLQALGECTDVANRRLMPPGFEWTDAFAGAADFMDCVHDLLYTIDGDEHTSKEMFADIMKRLTPRGYEWPRYIDTGELLKYGDAYIGIDGNNHRAWHIRFDSNADVHVSYAKDGDCFDGMAWDYFDKGERVKRPGTAAIAADDEPLEIGQTVWPVDGGGPLYVKRVDVESQTVTTRPFGLSTAADDMEFEPSQLTHTEPESSDTWERIEEDAESVAKLFDYFDADASEDIRAIVRRCKALAEKGETE